MSDVLDFLNMSDEDAKIGAEEYRAKTKKPQFTGGSSFNVSNIKVGKSATWRFISADPGKKVYPEFTVVKKMIPLSFVDPENDSHFIRLSIPVLEMYEPTKKCPLVEKVRPLYKEAKELKNKGKEQEAKLLTKLANQHWIDPEYIGQGFVINAGFDEENVPENPIRRIYLRKTIYRLVDLGMNATEEAERLPYWPAHPRLGFNFIIRKTVKQTEDGPQNSYEQSGWARQSTPLTDEQIAAIEKYGIPDLTQALPKRPSEEEYAFFSILMDKSLAGERTWDPDWEDHLVSVKPFKVDRDGKLVRDRDESAKETSSLSERVRERLGDDSDGESSDTVMSKLGTSASVDSPVETDDAEPTATPPKSASTADIAAKIRSRMGKKS